MFRVCHTILSIHCSPVVTCWERVDLLAFLYVMFSCVFVTFSFSVLCQVWYLIVSIPDLCLLSYFRSTCVVNEKTDFGLTCVMNDFENLLSRDMRFPTMWYVRPVKPQISLRK